MLHTPEFWVAVGFVLLVVSIFRPVARAIGSALDARADRIKSTLDEAARLREELEAEERVCRVLRGGSFAYTKHYARCAYRYRSYPDSRYNNQGFRCVVSPFF